MVGIGIVRMLVRHRFVPMRVDMRLVLIHAKLVSMLVVFLVDVAVLMLEQGVGVSMPVVFGEVEPYSGRHERARGYELPTQRLAEQRQSDQGAGERRG